MDIQCESIEIFGNFKECHVNVLHNHLLFEETCFADDFEPNAGLSINPYLKHNVTVLSKRDYFLEDIGFECSMKKTKITYIQDFFLNKYEAGPVIEDVPLSKLDCWKMIKEQKCNSNPMGCKSNKTCHYIEPPEIDYPQWFGKNAHIYYECQFNEKMVVATSHSSSVLHDAIEPCFPLDEVCYLPFSTVVWKTNMLRECPFERVLDILDLQIELLENGHHALVSKEEFYLFELVEERKECGTLMTTTTQGQYLIINPTSKEKAFIDNLPKSKLAMEHFQEKDYRDLILAENDSKFMLFKKEIYKIECSLMLNSIRPHLNDDDTFIEINFLGNI